MPIYTKIGDNGKTFLFKNKLVSKSNPIIEAYGSLDELSSYLGLLYHNKLSSKDNQNIITIQKDLYLIMAFLSGASLNKRDKLLSHIKMIEDIIDSIEKKLPKLSHFILYQGSVTFSLLHVVRSIARRAERKTVICFQKFKTDSKSKKIVLQYLNRLSDFLFILARKYNTNKEVTLK